MRDHWRVLGTLFMAWAVTQAVTATIALVSLSRDPRMQAGPGQWGLAIAVTLLAVVAYFYVGVRLRQHDPRARIPGIVLAVLALLSFPIGTAVGAFALYVLIKYREPRALQA